MKLILDRKGDLTRVGVLVTNTRYWGAASGQDASAWVVDGGNTLPGEVYATQDYRVRCVRDNGARETRGWPYAVNGTTIVVKDAYGQGNERLYPLHAPWPVTPVNKADGYASLGSGLNLMGSRYELAAVQLEKCTWADAAAKCAAYSQEAADAGTWRLPTAMELAHVAKLKDDLNLVMKLTTDVFWSATENSAQSDGTMAFAYNLRQNTPIPSRAKTASLPILCVRDVVNAGVRLYPYVTNGNMIVTKDDGGEADPVAFPTHEAWTKTPEHAESNWYANATEWNSIGEQLFVAKADAAAPTSLADAESKCAAYTELKNDIDAGLWRMPTLREVLAFAYEFRHLLTGPSALTSGKNYVSRTATPTGALYAVAQGSHVVSLSDWTDNPALRCVRDKANAKKYPYRDGRYIVLKDEVGEGTPLHTGWSGTPAHTELAWDANASGNNTYGSPRFYVAAADAKGKDGASTKMTWYEATGTTDATNNPGGYDACLDYYENNDFSDVGTWRTPTVRELHAMFDLGAITAKDCTFLSRTASSLSAAWTARLDGSTGAVVISAEAKSDASASIRCVRDENYKARTHGTYPYTIPSAPKGYLFYKDAGGSQSVYPFGTPPEGEQTQPWIVRDARVVIFSQARTDCPFGYKIASLGEGAFYIEHFGPSETNLWCGTEWWDAWDPNTATPEKGAPDVTVYRRKWRQARTTDGRYTGPTLIGKESKKYVCSWANSAGGIPGHYYWYEKTPVSEDVPDPGVTKVLCIRTIY